MDEIVMGVFSVRERAEKYMDGLMRDFHTAEGWKLFRVDRKAQDIHGTCFYEIVERRLDQ